MASVFGFAMAHAPLTRLGAVTERTGLDRKLRVNTVKKPAHSLFPQGAFGYSAIPVMSQERRPMLMTAFAETMQEHA